MRRSKESLRSKQLELRVAELEAVASDAAAAAQAAALASEGALSRRDAAIRQYFEFNVKELLDSFGGAYLRNDDAIMGLTRELCALKLVESQLGMRLEASSLHADALAMRSAALRKALSAAESQISSLEKTATQIPKQDHASASRRKLEQLNLEDHLHQLTERLARKDRELKQTEGKAQAAEASAARAAENEARALERLREQIALEHAAQLRAVESEHLDTIERQKAQLEVGVALYMSMPIACVKTIGTF